MKRIMKIFMCLTVSLSLVTLFALPSFAEDEILGADGFENVSEGESALENENAPEGEILDVENLENTSVGENLPQEENGSDGKSQHSDSVSFWDRLSEYISGDKLSTTVTFAYNIFCTVILVLMKRSTKTSSLDLARIITASDKSSRDRLNELTKVYNENEKEVEALKKEIKLFREEHKIKTVTAEQFTAALEGIRDIGIVLQTIYQNSSTVPAVIKTNVIKKVTELNEIIDQAEKSVEEDEYEKQN